MSLFSGSPTGPGTAGGTRGNCIIRVPDDGFPDGGFPSGTTLWPGWGTGGESAVPLGSAKGIERMKERGGKSVLVCGESGSIWAGWMLEDRGRTEEAAPAAKAERRRH